MSFVYIVLLAALTLVSFAIGQGSNSSAYASAWLFFPSVILLYFSPSITAWLRGHPRTAAIAILNLFLGWTLIGWVGALVWAYSPPVDRGHEVHIEDDADTKACPYCAETIKSAAIRCRFCGADLAPNLAAD